MSKATSSEEWCQRLPTERETDFTNSVAQSSHKTNEHKKNHKKSTRETGGESESIVAILCCFLMGV